MKLILGGINGEYLRAITDGGAAKTEEVLAAVAYATDDTLLFDWCWQHQIALKFYGRLDDCVAVSVPILRAFLNRKSSDFVCRLVKHHHAKVIWWRGLGVYIGSANLSHSAWYNNIEAGCFFPEGEIAEDMAADIEAMFAKLEEHSTPLTEELLQEMSRRDQLLIDSEPPSKNFWQSPSFKDWSGLGRVVRKKVSDQRRQKFLEEWHSTLQEIRDIGAVISRPENRPSWVSSDIPVGAQADQFLHAHYYERTFEDGRAKYVSFHEKNRMRRKEALEETIDWWRRLTTAPRSEATMLNETAPYLRAALSEESLATMTYEEFYNVCLSIHAIRDYSRRVSNVSVELATDGTSYAIQQKVAALSKRIWKDQSESGKHVCDLLRYILFGGATDDLPERLWQGVADPKWKIGGLGVSALGELVGWALPDKFPPRNGRTSKALRSLGYDVTVHV